MLPIVCNLVAALIFLGAGVAHFVTGKEYSGDFVAFSLFAQIAVLQSDVRRGNRK